MRAGWTLLEVMVVVTLIAMATAMATINLNGPLVSTRYQAFIQQVVDVDHQLRRQSLQSNRANHLTIDCQKQEIAYSNARGKQKIIGCPPRSQLKYWMDDTGQSSSKKVRIHYDSHGASSSFAVCIQLNRKETWIVFLGRTGEYLKLSSENEAKQILEEAKSFGTDAR